MLATVLTVAGSDCSGAAGAQLDLSVIAACGAHGASVLTAVTAQRGTSVDAVLALPRGTVRDQLRSVFRGLDVAAVKSGMLASADAARELATALGGDTAIPYVCDPVLRATGGTRLLEGDAVAVLLGELFPRATLATPNADELEALSGAAARTPAQAAQAARRLLERGTRAVLVTGGHFTEERGTDVLVTRDGERRIEGAWSEGPPVRGTGCAYSAAIAGQLALGHTLPDAVARSRALVARWVLRAEDPVGSGVMRVLRPDAGAAEVDAALTGGAT